ncbi:MFS transporter [Phenylobacterium kunshanense]|uniref:MFS transporter n=1 Tax=Phenylobacterium kunshanense TaxID=1445034 RepID=UPI00140266E5|nr:MFS transporter [Phenylobacterium kunshanense]
MLLSACALRFFDAFVLIAPFYTVMFAERGLTPAQIGIVLASWSMVGVVLEAPCGVLADRWSRRWILAIAQLLRVVGFMIWIAFPNFWGFLIGLMLWGMKSASLSGCFEALIYDELAALKRQGEYVTVYGRTQAARFSGVVAASLGAAVAAGLGYDALIWAGVAAGLAAAIAAMSIPQAPKVLAVGRWDFLGHLARGAKEAASRPDVPALLLFIAGMQAITYACSDYWQLFGLEVGLTKPGIALFVASLSAVGALAAWQAHRLRRLPLTGLCVLLAIAGACLTLAAATFQVWSIVLPLAFVALYWLVDTNADARFQHALNPETRATVASLKGFVMQCGTSVLMLTFGLVADSASYQAAFFGAGLAAMLLGGSYALWARGRG